MASAFIPGSSRPYSIDADADASCTFESDGEQELSAVPLHPHTEARTKITPVDTPRREPHQFYSGVHPTVSGSARHVHKDCTSAPDTQSKRKSIGSKLLSKFRHSSVDERGNPSSTAHSQTTSGSQTPYNDHHGAESDSELGADKLRQALTKEQQSRARTKQASFSSMDGLRHRGIFRKKSKQTQLDSDIGEDDDPRDSEEIPHSASAEPALLDRLHSDADRHFPGGLYEADSASEIARMQREAVPSHHLSRRHSGRTPATAHRGNGAFTADDEEGNELLDDDHQRDYDSDDSDDTIAHLIREADGYDSLRYNKNGELSARLDYDTLHAVREKERSISDNKDAQSAYSAYSGGAAKALSQPLLELEDIELETFLQNFARHTKEVTVTRPAGMQKYRMPKWSDFRVSPEEEMATGRDNKRPSMLSRVDRGLHHLSDNLSPQSIAKGASKLTGQQGQQTESPSMPRSKSADDELEAESASESDDRDTKTNASPKKSTKPKALKKQNSANGKKFVHQDNADDEDWDLIVPSSSRTESYDTATPHEELRVNAEDEGVDGVAFCIAYILALVERLAPEEIDHHPDRGYREGLIRSHLERLYTIAPFWEQLAFRIRRLYRWEDPKTTAAAAMIYFVLWYTNMIPTAFILMIMFYIMRFKYFPPSESYLHDKVKMRMARGRAANTLSEKLRRRSRLDILNIYKRWVVTFGAPTQEAMGLVADFHEKVKNLILWRNTGATRRTLILFGVLNLFVTFAPAQYVSKAIFFFLGITFFCLLPLQSYFPSHRKALSPLWWATFGAPTDAQFAVQLLRKRHLDIDRFAGQLTTAEDVRRAVRSHGGNSKLKPRPDRREEGIAYDQIEDPSRASLDYVEMSNDATLKPRKLGSFFCQYKGLPGRLHVNTKYLYFTPLHSPSHKRGRTPVDAIESIVKTKSIRLMVWSSLGLKIVRNNGKAPLLLANLPNRDEAFNLILAVSANAGAKAC